MSNPMKNATISKMLIQTRVMKLIAIASGIGKMGESMRVITPSRTPRPPGAKTATEPLIQANV